MINQIYCTDFFLLSKSSCMFFLNSSVRNVIYTSKSLEDRVEGYSIINILDWANISVSEMSIDDTVLYEKSIEI